MEPDVNYFSTFIDDLLVDVKFIVSLTENNWNSEKFSLFCTVKKDWQFCFIDEDEQSFGYILIGELLQFFFVFLNKSKGKLGSFTVGEGFIKFFRYFYFGRCQKR